MSELEPTEPETPADRARRALANRDYAGLQSALADHPELLTDTSTAGDLFVQACHIDKGRAALQILFNHGLDPHMIARGYPLIFLAASRGHVAAIDMLIDRGVDVRSTFQGRNLLSLARGDAVGYLIKLGVPYDKPADDGNTILHIAARQNKEVLIDMIARGMDVNARNDNGFTPLHFAAIEGYDDHITILLDAGADINARTTKTANPISYIGLFSAGKKSIPAGSTALDIVLWQRQSALMTNSAKWNSLRDMLISRGARRNRANIFNARIAEIGCWTAILLMIPLGIFVLMFNAIGAIIGLVIKPFRSTTRANPPNRT
jgi:hypothetical protein